MPTPSYPHQLTHVAVAILMACSVLTSGCDQDALNSDPTPALSLEESLQFTLDSARQLNNLTGLSAAVILPDRSTWLGVSGMSDPTTSQQIEPDMLFGIGSITKTYTAVLILQLMEEGLLTLDDPLHQWLPRFPNIDSTATLRQLLTHTSGIFSYTDDPVFFEFMFDDPTRNITPEEIFTFVKEPLFAPGNGWSYSNTNFILLGMVIEAVTHSSVDVELRNRLLNPLNLDNTYLNVEGITTDNFAHNWSSFLRGDGVLEDISSFPRIALYRAAWTSGAMISTAEETARFTEALYSGEVLNQATMEKMLAFHPISQSVWTGYGLGVQRIEVLDRELWGHGGSIPGYVSFTLYSNQDKVSIAVLINQDSDEDETALTIATELLKVVMDS